jgi:serine/threonine protein kinase
VYRARDTRLDRTVAIKVLADEIAADSDLRSRFEREARAVAALDHPHICGIYDVGEANGIHYLVMPCLEGQTLAARLEKGPLPVSQALTIACEIADALDKAHRQGIVHRDLKPANIMLTKAGAKLLDFGLAKLRGPGGPISMSGMVQMATTLPGLGTDMRMMSVDLPGGNVNLASTPKALFQARVPLVASQRTNYVVSRDGQRFLINTAVGDGLSSPLSIVLNWPAALKQ